jgi:hypothetical protein
MKGADSMNKELKPTEWGDTITPEMQDELSNGKGDDDDE